MSALKHFTPTQVNTVIVVREKMASAPPSITVSGYYLNTLEQGAKDGKPAIAIDFAGNKYNNKTDFLLALGKDRTISNYLSPEVKKDIAQVQTEPQQERERGKTAGFDR